MKVVRWGDGLGVSIPAPVAEALGLHEGDEVEVQVVATQKRDVAPGAERQRARETLRRLARPFPPGFRFNRDEANER